MISLMAKPVSVGIPVMLLVLDWYPLKRISGQNLSRVLAEKLPFAVIAIVMTALTLKLAGNETILVSFQEFPLYRRFILAGNALFEYLRMTLYPAGLINIHLLPRVFPASYYIAALGMFVFSCYSCFSWKRRPWLLATWLLFLIPLVPVLGFFQNGAQAYADRFTYLPAVALSIAAAGAFGNLCSRSYGRFRHLAVAGAVSVLAVLGVISVNQIGAWKNAETLWTRVISIQPIGRAYSSRASYRVQAGRYLEAVDDLTASIRIGHDVGFTGLFNLYALRGDAFSRAGRYREAVEDFTEAINLYPHASYHYHRAIALEKLGKVQEAKADFLQAGNQRGPIEWQ
jgi:tetratricopeptide (TPR) repeat protein